MKSHDLLSLFIHELENAYNSEIQIHDFLVKSIKTSSVSKLKDLLKKHIKETENHREDLERIFLIIDVSISNRISEAMKGIIKEAKEFIKNSKKSPLLDAAIITHLRKIESYEISTYESLNSFAEYMDLDAEVTSILYKIHEEEKLTLNTLTKIANGSLFSSGVIKKAAENSDSYKKRGNMATKYGSKAQNSVKDAMHKMKKGELESGKSHKPVKSRKQAIAIGLSEARKKGAKVPKKKT